MMKASRTLPEAATRTKTMPESLWESNSGESRGFKVCLPKKREVSNKMSLKAGNDKPLRPREARIEGETAVIDNPNVPRHSLPSTMRSTTRYAPLKPKMAQQGHSRLETPRCGPETGCRMKSPKNAKSLSKAAVVNSNEQKICQQNSQSPKTSKTKLNTRQNFTKSTHIPLLIKIRYYA